MEPSINECFTGKNAMNWKVVGVISGEKTLLDYLWQSSGIDMQCYAGGILHIRCILLVKTILWIYCNE